MSRDGRPPASSAITFDSEALLAFLRDEEGAALVEDVLSSVAEGSRRGYLNDVNAAEVWYILKRRSGIDIADDRLDWLRAEMRLQPVGSEETWQKAAAIKADHPMSLADAFALATAQLKDCPVLAGKDEEFEAGRKIGVDVHRIRMVRGG